LMKAEPSHAPGPLVMPSTLYRPTPYLAYLAMSAVPLHDVPLSVPDDAVHRKPANSRSTSWAVIGAPAWPVTVATESCGTSIALFGVDAALASWPLMVA